MPLTGKGTEILKSMEKTYGKENAERVLYASKNKGTITGIDSIADDCQAVADQVESLNRRMDAMDARAAADATGPGAADVEQAAFGWNMKAKTSEQLRELEQEHATGLGLVSKAIHAAAKRELTSRGDESVADAHLGVWTIGDGVIVNGKPIGEIVDAPGVRKAEMYPKAKIKLTDGSVHEISAYVGAGIPASLVNRQ